ncbi:MAG: family 1 glycosylhydrolase [Syntrophothermus sp.]
METFNNKRGIEIWGGVECTIVRVKNQVHDQLELNGHEKRIGDLALFADLGITTLRYPLLWEKYIKSPDAFFKLHEKRLEELRRLKIKPIAGLLHHGSGPFCTDLLDPEFPEKLAEYAGLIAKRFPHLDLFTPVNEPLTTARFSGLYGIWYPHKKDDASFVKMFLNEIRGIILSMREIRKHIPGARLIQTEDICRIHSTPDLKYQADFENERRWLTYDILNNRFDEKHPLWGFFRNFISEEELSFFNQEDVRPDIMGLNYYVTSERFLDHRYARYPLKKRGGNGRQNYADIECVRVDAVPDGFYNLLKEAWNRYGSPMALSEVHLACSREEQMRWFYEAYQTALKLQSEGIDFRAITAWSVLGAYGWSTLLRRNLKRYESGVFDLGSGVPRPTALARLIRQITHNEEINHPLLAVQGWWKRDVRIIYPGAKNVTNPQEMFLQSENEKYREVRPLMIIGANGALGKAIARQCQMRGIVYVPLGRDMLDITSEETIRKRIHQYNPWAVINAAGYSGIDEAEMEPIRCFRENTMGAIVLAKVCAMEEMRLMTFSTDQVFNGRKRNPYIEKDITAPLNTFGLSKRMAEERILNLNSDILIIRSSSFFNPWNPDDFLVRLLTKNETGEGVDLPVFFSSDVISSPAYVPELVNLALDLLIDNESGIWHISSKEGLSQFEFARLAIDLAGQKHLVIQPTTAGQMNDVARRPSYSVLMSSRGISLPPLEQLLYHFLREFNNTLAAAV